MKNSGEKLETLKVDIKNSVMSRIRREKIVMRHPFIFLAQKLGLQSTLVLAILFNALLVSVLLYFLKKTGLLKFLSFGWPGLKVILYSLPYDYFVLFLIALALAVYIIKKIDFASQNRFFANVPTVTLLLITVFIGTFFALMGAEQIIKNRVENKLPEDLAVFGKVINSLEKEIIIQAEDGRLVKIIFEEEKMFPFLPEYARGKFARAVGHRHAREKDVFYADEIRCCEKE